MNWYKRIDVPNLRKLGLLKVFELTKIPPLSPFSRLTKKDITEIRCLFFAGNEIVINGGMVYILTPSTYKWWERVKKKPLPLAERSSNV